MVAEDGSDGGPPRWLPGGWDARFGAPFRPPRPREGAFTDPERRRGGWWEYCLLRRRGEGQTTTWRIRPLYIARVGRRFPERIWGGKHIWLRDQGAVRVALVSAMLAIIAWEAFVTLASAL